MTSRALFLAAAVALVCSGCPGGQVCGNGVVDPGEACDGQALNGQTCPSVGFGPGTLFCTATCQLDRTSCGAPTTCGNNLREGVELCDGPDLGGASCASLGHGGGTLSCASNCGGFDLSACAAPVTCNNGKVDPGEVCDGADLGGMSCEGLGFKAGTLSCASNCLSHQTSGCQSNCVPQCGTRTCGLDPVCNQPCGTCDAQSVCGSEGRCQRICDLPAFTQDSVLDLDVKTVTLTGKLTLNGQPLPNNTQSNSARGTLRFIHLSSNDTLTQSLGPSGDFSYRFTLYPGTYDVVLEPNSAANQNVFPAYRHTLRARLEVQQSGALDFDLKTVKVQGELTLNGAALPANNGNSARGTLRFSQGEGSLTASLGATGAGLYNLTLWAGPHAVLLEPNSAANQNVFPAYKHLLSAKEDFLSDTTRNFNAATARLSGQLTLNGAPLPNNGSASSRGTLQFIDTGSNGMLSSSLGASGAGTYSVTLFAGSYDVQLAPGNGSNQNVFPPLLYPLAENLSVTVDGARDFDAQTVTVTGAVTLNGAALPSNASSNSRGSLVFKDARSGQELSFSFGAQGPVNYTVKLFAGAYDVQVVPGNAANQNVLPAIEHRVLSRAAFTSDTTRDLDLKTVTITGAVTLNGATLPNNTLGNSTRGNLYFVDRTTWTKLSVSLGATGEASFSVVLFAGRYDVELYPGSATHQSVFPDHDERVLDNVDFSASTSKWVDVKVVNVTGTVTLNGSQLPNNGKSTAERGSLRFTSRSMGDHLSTSLRTSGVGTYALKLFAGSYDVSLEPGSAGNQDVFPAYRTQLRTGCVARGACSLSKGDVSGTWRMSTSSQWRTWYLNLSQSGSRLSGTYEYFQASGALVGGTVNGDRVDVTAKPYNCYVNFNGELLDGCTLVGTLTPSGVCGGWGATAFFGQRSN